MSGPESRRQSTKKKVLLSLAYVLGVLLLIVVAVAIFPTSEDDQAPATDPTLARYPTPARATATPPHTAPPSRLAGPMPTPPPRLT